MRTPVCELLGIGQPIVQAPMAAVPRLAAAVSNPGALGMVTLTWSDDAGAVVRETAALTARPFGGNFILTEDHHPRLNQALDAGLRIVSFMWGDPSGYVEPVHAAGGVVMHTVGSAEEARRAVESGVDVVVRGAGRSGGHVWRQGRDAAVGTRCGGCGHASAGDCGRRDRGCPRSCGGARPWRTGRVAGHAVPAGPGDADP